MSDKDKKVLEILSLVIMAANNNILPAVLRTIGDWAKEDPTLEDIEALKSRLPDSGDSYFE